MSTVARSLVAAIEAAWSGIRAQHTDVPDVVVTMASGSAGRSRGVRLGHFGPDRWELGGTVMPELFVGGEGFAAGPEAVLCTLLHEAAHGIARSREVKETSRGGRYHNTRYKELAMELGLGVERTGSTGWSVTMLGDEVSQRYRREIDGLSRAIVGHRREEHPPTDYDDGTAAPGTDTGDDDSQAGPEERGSRNGSALTCECLPTPRRVRAHKRTIEAGPIICGVCGQVFAITPAA
ncbi:MAG: hypothetical protein HOQ24_08595 [Mycobacteriaceae bacterium]|nr:hypothetical protein [Mycobacteriaceae bacterium]